jgi:methylenetetrahydrofolate reductase (NADPH)
VGYADAVNLTDNPAASAHMTPVAGAALVAAAGLEPIVQLTCRDRNRLGLSADLLGGWALGARSILCLTGDPPSVGDHPGAKAVFDLDIMQLISLVAGLRDAGRLLSGAEVTSPPRYFIGVADTPLSPRYDWDRLERKADAGADFVQTQIVFDIERFEAWAATARERGLLERMFLLAGVAVPRNVRSARYMRDHLPGVIVPDAVFERLEASDAPEEEGVRLAVEVVAKLKGIPGIAGIHVMGLGQMDPVRRVIQAAGLLPRPAAV